MKTKEITIAGKQVTLAYCFSTEIEYKDDAHEEMIDYIRHALGQLSNEKDPDIKRSFSAIFSCIVAYSKAITPDGKEAVYPITMKELMNNTSPAEFIAAVLTVIDLRDQFYRTTDEAPVPDSSSPTATVPDASSSGNEDSGKNA